MSEFYYKVVSAQDMFGEEVKVSKKRFEDTEDIFDCLPEEVADVTILDAFHGEKVAYSRLPGGDWTIPEFTWDDHPFENGCYSDLDSSPFGYARLL